MWYTRGIVVSLFTHLSQCLCLSLCHLHVLVPSQSAHISTLQVSMKVWLSVCVQAHVCVEGVCPTHMWTNVTGAERRQRGNKPFSSSDSKDTMVLFAFCFLLSQTPPRCLFYLHYLCPSHRLGNQSRLCHTCSKSLWTNCTAVVWVFYQNKCIS